MPQLLLGGWADVGRRSLLRDAAVACVSGSVRLDHPRHWRQLRLNRPNRPGFRCLRPFAAVRSLPLPLPLVFIMSMLLSGRRMSPATLRSALQTLARAWVWASGFPLLAAALNTFGSSGSTRSTLRSRAFWKSFNCIACLGPAERLEIGRAHV